MTMIKILYIFITVLAPCHFLTTMVNTSKFTSDHREQFFRNINVQVS